MTVATATPDFLTREPEHVYRAKADEYLSSHRLAEFRRCPALYRKRQLGLIPDDDRPAYAVGRAAHTLILEGMDVLRATYAVGGPINPATNKPFGSRTKAYADWASAQGRPVLSDEDLALILELHFAVQESAAAMDLLADGMPEGVVRAAYCGMPCQGRIDWFSPERGIVDLKTCDGLDWFEASARSYGYVHQLAFYRSLVTAACGDVLPVYMLSVEKRQPFRCGVWRMGEGVLGQAQKENEEAIERLKGCEESDVWPTGYEEPRSFDWM